MSYYAIPILVSRPFNLFSRVCIPSWIFHLFDRPNVVPRYRVRPRAKNLIQQTTSSPPNTKCRISFRFHMLGRPFPGSSSSIVHKLQLITYPPLCSANLPQNLAPNPAPFLKIRLLRLSRRPKRNFILLALDYQYFHFLYQLQKPLLGGGWCRKPSEPVA